MGLRLKPLLYLICGLTDFAAFIVVFAVSRGLAEAQAEPWRLGVAGAGFAFTAGLGSALGGWLAHRFDGRVIFVSGNVLVTLSCVGCGVSDPVSFWFLPVYWLLGIGVGFLYPPLIGWLNQGEDAHTNRRGVSRNLIMFCVAWNVGMMAGQLTAGRLFAIDATWTYGAAIAAALVNVGLALVAASRVVRLSAAHAVDAAPEHADVKLAAAFKRLGWIANLGGMFGGSMVLHLLPDLVVLIDISANSHGVMLACWRVVIIATYLIMHHVAFWHYRLSVSLTSQVLAAVGLIIIARAESAESLLAGLVLLGQLVGYNYFSGLYYATAGSRHEGRALAAGLHEATLAGGMAVGTIVGGVVGTVLGPRAPYVLAAAVILMLFAVQGIVWWKWVRPLWYRAQLHQGQSRVSPPSYDGSAANDAAAQ
ncbi:MAG: MFS transporter [Planctomycetes bacterium]|nr:MFS transporter [Planctomycetota bacterium]